MDADCIPVRRHGTEAVPFEVDDGELTGSAEWSMQGRWAAPSRSRRPASGRIGFTDGVGNGESCGNPGPARDWRALRSNPDHSTLIDAKTGPRQVLLGEAARELLDGLAETASGEWLFPGKGKDEPLNKNEL